MQKASPAQAQRQPTQKHATTPRLSHLPTLTWPCSQWHCLHARIRDRFSSNHLDISLGALSISKKKRSQKVSVSSQIDQDPSSAPDNAQRGATGTVDMLTEQLTAEAYFVCSILMHSDASVLSSLPILACQPVMCGPNSSPSPPLPPRYTHWRMRTPACTCNQLC